MPLKLKIGALQEEHLQIQSSREDGSKLSWSEVNNMPYTAKVSRTVTHFFMIIMQFKAKTKLC